MLRIKKMFAFLLAVSLVFGMVVPAVQADEGISYFIKPADFAAHLGTWKIVSKGAGAFGDILEAPSKTPSGGAVPAVTAIEIKTPGTYQIWARSRDFVGGTDEKGNPLTSGNRNFEIEINGIKLDQIFGKHGVDGWKWELGGSVTLPAGTNIIKMIDTNSYYGRCEAIVLTTDPSFSGPDSQGDLGAAFVEQAAVLSPDSALHLQDENYYLLPRHFAEKGSWSQRETYLQGTTAGAAGAASAEPAVTQIYIERPGEYTLWVRDRDYEQDRPGSRFFNVMVDDRQAPVTFGTHGQEGFRWTKGGTFFLNQGTHALSLVDTSGFYARCEALLVTGDPQLTPPEDLIGMQEICQPYEAPAYYLKPADFAENLGTWKITHQGAGAFGDILEAPSKVPEGGAKPAEISIEVDKPGSYTIWARSRDYVGGTDASGVPLQSGVRNFELEVNGSRVGKVFGKHGVNGWAWEKGGTVELKAGTNQISVIDTASYYGRCEAIALTMDPLFQGPDTKDSLDTAFQNHPITPTYVDVQDQHYYFVPGNFSDTGTWIYDGTFLQGLSSGSGGASAARPAVLNANIEKGGLYRLWVRDRDFAADRPGTRKFKVAVDGVAFDHDFGTHGQEGFQWTEAGTLRLAAGIHTITLVDTSANFARCEGLFLTGDLGLVPPEDKGELAALYPPYEPFSNLPDAAFPAWATADIPAAKTATIENGKVRVVFYQGQGANGPLVQNAIFIKDGSEWIQVKGKTEELGFLMMTASGSSRAGQRDNLLINKQTVKVNGADLTSVTDSYFRSGRPVWFLPSDFQKISDNQIKLSFPNIEASMQVTFELDQLAYDPKVTLDAEFNRPGAYSFLLFSGNETAYQDFETVTAPLLYVKKAIPENDAVTPECYLFTPMATLTYPASNTRVPGRTFTSGIVIDPTCVPQDFAYPNTSRFGMLLRTPSGHVKPQFCAPLFGSSQCMFQSGDRYTISYRIVNQLDSWYNTFKHISQDIYSLHDARSNYYTSINEAIYNATDLMLDDDYGGWDEKDMAHYNMERRDLSTVSDGMSAMQRYLLTDNKEILEKRAVPTLAFLLSRKQVHFKKNDTPGGSTGYLSTVPSPIGSPVSAYGTSVYGGLYEMTQGRMPFLLDYAKSHAKTSGNLAGVADQGAMYKYTGDSTYLNQVKTLADRYISNNPNAGANREKMFVDGFVFGDYTMMVATFVTAYELTGEQKYLLEAEKAARLLTTGLWTTGYQNGYAENTYAIDPVQTGQRLLNCEGYDFWWHGDTKWRLGNPDGLALRPQLSGPPLTAETIPGWLSAKAGMGTEHPRTPGHGNVISMNNWAGNLVKLSVYTGDPYFQMQAHNAMIGRFGNYPGYYQDRYISHQMKPEYPYTGPDYTSIYWHHIPVFISMLEDYLINEAWARSQQHIAFPSLYQMGYAYFATNQFGHAPGNFYDQDGMWLWLDRDIIVPDSVQVDYIAARKDGVLGLALMNEGNVPLSTTIALGEKVPGGAAYTGPATLYDCYGFTTQIDVTNGAFSVTIPEKGIASVVLNLPGMKAPSYAKANVTYSTELGGTVSEHTRGKGYVIQAAPDRYSAYLYITDMAETAASLKIDYQIGDNAAESKTVSAYPFEFLISVDQPSQAFTYTLTLTKNDGTTENLGGGTLQPLLPFTPFDAQIVFHGIGANQFRFVAPLSAFPFDVTENSLAGLKVSGTFTHKADGTVIPYEGMISANEMRTGQTVLVVPATAALPADKDHVDNYTVQLTVRPY